MDANINILSDRFKKIYLFIGILILILFVSRVTYSLWIYAFEDTTEVVFTVLGEDNNKFSCSADGGGSITSNDVVLAPAKCTSNTFAIKREVRVMPKIEDDLKISLGLWLEIGELGEGLSNSENFRYALTTSDNSCSDGLVSSGNFNGKQVGDTVNLLENVSYTETTTDYYYLYIWLDEAETSSDTMNQPFDLSLGGVCEGIDGAKFDDHTLMITSYTCNYGKNNEVTVGNNPYFTYTGECDVEDDGDGNWRIKFLTDGDFISNLNIPIDVFLVGGGGGGSSGISVAGGGGGGGGYTTMTFANLKKDNIYFIDIGAGGNKDQDGLKTTGFNSVAFGGMKGSGTSGGSGGSGGGSYYGDGGSNGSAGVSDSGGSGIGQGISTREFGEENGVLYSGGGGGEYGLGGSGGGGNGGNSSDGVSATPNTGGGGGGGGGSDNGGSGGSGIVVIRNTRINSDDVKKLPSVAFDFTYENGYYLIQNEGSGNWKIKFLTDGTFKIISDVTIPIDVFLVGGGGGGSSGISVAGGGGGGGGGYTTMTFANLKKDNIYFIDIGAGGNKDQDGLKTTGFNSVAFGGMKGSGASGGSGGSGGGSYYGDGGSNGSAGVSDSGGSGIGQGISTREFGEENGVLYSGGGGGEYGLGGSGGGGNGGNSSDGVSATPNTGGGGGGGGGSDNGGSGGSGIVVIRNTRINSDDVKKLPSVAFDFTYENGYYLIQNEGSGNWKIKFLTDGTFKIISDVTIPIDVFLVGGGGGGSSGISVAGGGGGGGGYTTNGSINISNNESYVLDIGAGGSSDMNGKRTDGFGFSANYGYSGVENDGGKGGSGGGSYYGDGGSDGSDGISDSGIGGIGYGISTREFGEENGVLYAGGGGGEYGLGGSGGGGNGGNASDGVSATPNTGGGGGGGGGSDNGGNGGSGIVIIRNSKNMNSSNTYTISYNLNGGSGNIEAQTKNHGSALTLTSTVPTREGYAFLGWSTSSDATTVTYQSGESITEDEDITLYAVWQINTYAVKTNYYYYYQNTTMTQFDTKTETVNYGTSYIPQAITAPAGYPSVDYYDYFDESYTKLGNGLISNSDSFVVNQNIYVHIYYYPEQYAISYNANGGSGAPSAQTKYYATTLTLSSTIPTREGYTFLGWHTSSDATSAQYESGGSYTVNASVTLYAVWQANEINLTFNTNGGSFITSYTNSGAYTYEIPLNGNYKLEVWGAQGGSYNSSCIGGYGGYSVGEVYLNANSNLYVNVGGVGLGDGTHTSREGGYNGGGSATVDEDSNTRQSSGGGATHIANISGQLSSLSSNKSEILIVAGGGGGGAGNSAVACISGGSGGGYIGVDGVRYQEYVQADIYGIGHGGTQISGGEYTFGGRGYVAVGSFGQGANSVFAGGGGGFYGGGVGVVSAGGGSGYIGNTLLANKAMYCYGCSTSNEENTLTYSTTDVSGTATSNYVKSGDGAAKITFLGTAEKTVQVGFTYGTLPTLEKPGYKFKGWSTSSNGETLITSNTVVSATSDQTLYAVWELSTLYLYNNGDHQNTSITGGWNNSSFTRMYAESGTNDPDTSTVPERYTNNKIDLTPYKTLKFVYSDHGWGGCQGRFYVSSNQSTSGAVVFGTTGQSDRGTVTLDISNVTGSYYIYFQLVGYYKNGGYMTITEVVLE